MPEEIVVYYKPGCPFATRLRAVLTLQRIPFRSIRFRDDDQGAAKVREVNQGNEISPSVHIGEQWLTNPGARAIRLAAGR